MSVSFTVDVPGLGFLENNPGGSVIIIWLY